MNVEVRRIKTAADLALAETYAAAKTKLPGAGPVGRCARSFDAQGLPHRRVEEWTRHGALTDS